MQRHGTVSRKTMKTRHRKTTKATRKLASISARRSHSPAADLQEQLDRRTSELDEALALICLMTVAFALQLARTIDHRR